jgi:hypothetical protein
MPSAKAPGKITLEMRDVQDTWLDITVTDTGPGFGRRRSITRWTRSSRPRARAARASGCRWSMTWQARRWSGAPANRPGGGALVTLRLPLKPAEAEARPRLVMVVDDMAELRAARFA